MDDTFSLYALTEALEALRAAVRDQADERARELPLAPHVPVRALAALTAEEAAL